MTRPYYRCECGETSTKSLFTHSKEAEHKLYFERTDGTTATVFSPPGGSSYVAPPAITGPAAGSVASDNGSGIPEIVYKPDTSETSGDGHDYSFGGIKYETYSLANSAKTAAQNKNNAQLSKITSINVNTDLDNSYGFVAPPAITTSGSSYKLSGVTYSTYKAAQDARMRMIDDRIAAAYTKKAEATGDTTPPPGPDPVDEDPGGGDTGGNTGGDTGGNTGGGTPTYDGPPPPYSVAIQNGLQPNQVNTVLGNALQSYNTANGTNFQMNNEGQIRAGGNGAYMSTDQQVAFNGTIPVHALGYKYELAKQQAAGGDPTELRNLDMFFGVTRPEEEYTQAFYSIPKLKLIRGDGPAGPDDGNGNIGNGAAVYAVNASGDKFHVTAAAAAEMRANGTWTEPAVVSQSEVDNNYTTSFAINSASEIGIVNQKRTSQGYLLIRGDGPASADDGGLNSGNGAAVYALDKNGNMFHVTAAAAAEMRANGDWPTPFVMNQNKVDAMGVDGRMVGLGNIQPLVAVGPPPVPPAPEPVASAPEPAPVEPGSVVEPETGSNTTPAPEPDDSSDTSTEAPATPADEPTSESTTDAPAPEPEAPAAPDVDEQAQQEAAAAQEQEQEEEAALATATAAKHSAKESRMKKLMSMRKPWSSGASSSTGSDAMVAPPITPSSQIPPPPL